MFRIEDNIIEEEEDDKVDNDSGIQNDEKEEEEEKALKKEKKISKEKKKIMKIGSPKKSNKESIRGKSPIKLPASPQKSPKKRKRKVIPKPENKEHNGTIIANPQFDPDRTANRFANLN